jgi:hypothetical protein
MVWSLAFSPIGPMTGQGEIKPRVVESVLKPLVIWEILRKK